MAAAQREAAKREQILAGARRVFLEHGFEGTSTDAVAAAAGVSKQTLYRYFQSKEALLTGVIEAITVQRLFPSAVRGKRIANHDDLVRALRAFGREALTQLMNAEYIALFRLVVGESGRRPELADRFRQAIPEAAERALSGLLKEAERAGVVRSDIDIRVAVRMLPGVLLTWMLANGVFAGQGRPSLPPDHAVDELVRLFLWGVATTPRGSGQ